MRQIPDFVLRATLEELDEGHTWLATFLTEEKKEIRDQTPNEVLDRRREGAE